MDSQPFVVTCPAIPDKAGPCKVSCCTPPTIYWLCSPFFALLSLFTDSVSLCLSSFLRPQFSLPLHSSPGTAHCPAHPFHHLLALLPFLCSAFSLSSIYRPFCISFLPLCTLLLFDLSMPPTSTHHLLALLPPSLQTLFPSLCPSFCALLFPSLCTLPLGTLPPRLTPPPISCLSSPLFPLLLLFSNSLSLSLYTPVFLSICTLPLCDLSLPPSPRHHLLALLPVLFFVLLSFFTESVSLSLSSVLRPRFSHLLHSYPV